VFGLTSWMRTPAEARSSGAGSALVVRWMNVRRAAVLVSTSVENRPGRVARNRGPRNDSAGSPSRDAAPTRAMLAVPAG
jgi:hypothetical protein